MPLEAPVITMICSPAARLTASPVLLTLFMQLTSPVVERLALPGRVQESIEDHSGGSGLDELVGQVDGPVLR
jgi:hypothetical protein